MKTYGNPFGLKYFVYFNQNIFDNKDTVVLEGVCD